MREDTQKIIKEFKIKTIGNKTNIEKAESIVDPNENILFISPTNLIMRENNSKSIVKLPGIVILTNKRFYFNYHNLFDHSTEILDLNEIRSINSHGNGLTGGHIEIHSMVKSYDILVSYKKDDIHKIAKIFKEAAAQETNENDTQPVGNEDVFSKIENLSKLMNKGIITEKEFQQKKEELLKQI